MSIGLHIKQKLHKNGFSFSKNAQHFATEIASKKGILGNNSNTHQTNDLYLLQISLRNTIRKPSHRAHGQINNNNNNNNNNNILLPL